MKRSRHLDRATLLLGACSILACDRNGPAPSAEVATSSAPEGSAGLHVPPALSAEPAPADPLGVVWVDPPGFAADARKTGGFRKAYYALADEPRAELVVFYFGPGQGGTVAANFARWRAQFGNPPDDRVTRIDRGANDLTQAVLEIRDGTFTSGMPGQPGGGPFEGYAMLAAIVEAPDGQYFFKLTGPKAAVLANRQAFHTMLDGMHPRMR